MKTTFKFPAFFIIIAVIFVTACFEDGNPFDKNDSKGTGKVGKDDITENDSSSTDSLSCPILHFSVENDSFGVYYFTADFEGRDETPYFWHVDGEPIGQIAVEDSTNHTLVWQFNPGDHRVCIKSSTDECGELFYCESISYDPYQSQCPELSFTTNILSARNYEFFADTSKLDSVEWYGWMVNGQIVENEGNYYNGDGYLNYIFESEGYYEVCLVTETPNCPQGSTFCADYFIQFDSIPDDSTGTIAECRELGFNYALDNNDSTYTFTADFEDMDSISYSWSVFTNGDYLGGKTRQAGSNSSHNFQWYFEPNQNYVICLKQIDGDCENYQICEEIRL
ncbi:hypothetical protein [Marinigracilibium pacificum]|uniref:PKD domain-containing protein n=1 Tax=Marinigracilibium pacificum TaxID=2729599 RepID=A0A848J976_9BACT|nr:hypothetical protein [Marinigracilibium pacificum]NMM49602.1 hypothetical protein [Marinigracilibium pacificum]